MTVTAQFSEPDLGRLVRRFYAKVRLDPEIGPVFNNTIDDWDTHLDKLTDFWITVMLGVRRYKGNPLAAHLTLTLTPEMFDRWLTLWRETVTEVFAPPASDLLVAKAMQMSRNMQSVIFRRA